MTKHFVDLYQASIKGKSKRFKTNFTENAYNMANFEVNNTLVEYIPTILVNDNHFAPTEAKSLDVSNFLKILVAN